MVHRCSFILQTEYCNYCILMSFLYGMPGTDTGGSVRIPAAYCGILGFRPSHGVIPVVGVTPMAQSFDTVGIYMSSTQSLLGGLVPGCPWHFPVHLSLSLLNSDQDSAHAFQGPICIVVCCRVKLVPLQHQSSTCGWGWWIVLWIDCLESFVQDGLPRTQQYCEKWVIFFCSCLSWMCGNHDVF